MRAQSIFSCSAVLLSACGGTGDCFQPRPNVVLRFVEATTQQPVTVLLSFSVAPPYTVEFVPIDGGGYATGVYAFFVVGENTVTATRTGYQAAMLSIDGGAATGDKSCVTGATKQIDMTVELHSL